MALVGLLLALGLTLHWNGQKVQWPVLRPLNQALWRIGHSLKPGFFVDAQAPAPFAEAIPLPALLLPSFVPFWERWTDVRPLHGSGPAWPCCCWPGWRWSRYARLWPNRPTAGLALQLALAGVLLFEIIPPPLEALPFPPKGHPAYTWLSQQSIPGEGVANVFAAHPSTLVLSNHSYNLLAVSYTGQATVVGAGVHPRHTDVLNEWLATHEHPFWQPDFAQIMRSYRVRYIVMGMLGEWESGLWQEAQAAKKSSR